MNITIIGGGNNGCVLATKFSQKHNVTLYISNRNNELHDYHKNMSVLCEDTNKKIIARINCITDSLEFALNNADFIFITYPQFLFRELSEKMLPLLQPGKHLIFVPGSGGAEFWFKDALNKNCTITGLQRVHAVTRVIEKGKSARESGIRKSLKIASIPSSYSFEVKKCIEELYELPVEILSNYTNITLINSNPILHTSRLYSLFKNFNEGMRYSSIPLFYENWDIESSELLIKMDNELNLILNKLDSQGVDTKGIISILEHYESKNAKQLTDKITSIKGFKGLETPTIKVNNMFVPDFGSRYFISDFPYGLDIILSFARICNIQCNNLKMVSDWYHKLTKTPIVFNLGDFGINSINDIIELYI